MNVSRLGFETIFTRSCRGRTVGAPTSVLAAAAGASGCSRPRWQSGSRTGRRPAEGGCWPTGREAGDGRRRLSSSWSRSTGHCSADLENDVELASLKSSNVSGSPMVSDDVPDLLATVKGKRNYLSLAEGRY